VDHPSRLSAAAQYLSSAAHGLLRPCARPAAATAPGGRGPPAVRISAGAPAAGILTWFLVLAGAAILLRALGLSVGWGSQFQQPLFLAAMAVIVTLFACNLFGLYEIALPAWAQGAATLGQTPGPGHVPGLAGHFLTGALATLLATPCSAPFLGTAVGFALARGPAEILSIFAVLGLGLASPYLLIAALPVLATRLPRPGAWMVTLRRILGLLLLATALWLLSVLKAQVGATLAGLTGALLAALIAVIWIGRSQFVRKRPTAIATPALAGILALAAILLPAGLPREAPEPASLQTAAGAWPALDLAEIDRRVAAGEVVFVDVTADWCLTCKVNKRLVLQGEAVGRALGAKDVVLMQGDWTRPDQAIADYLASFGRYGIPFNAVYGPGAPEGIALPELLTDEAVLTALQKAGRTALAGKQ